MKYEELMQYKSRYHKTLYQEVVPFWLSYALDDSGALNNCLNESGEVLSKERYIWSQGRALWTFSALYNRNPHEKAYLDVATGLFNYLLTTGRDADGRWLYRFDEYGKVLDGDISIYVDGFVLIGMAEFYRATKDERAKEIALKTFENTYKRLKTPGSYQVAPYTIEQDTKTHGVNMIFSYFYYELGKVLDRGDICEAGYSLAVEILQDFYVKEKDAVLEFVSQNGEFLDTPAGRTCVPGHVVEGMWFLITIFEDKGEKEKIDVCCKLIKRHIELGLDKKQGGMILAIDIDGKEPCFWGKPTYKPWWVQLEALVATAYAYKHTKDSWFMEIHKQICEYAFSHYPSGSGEWHNWLDYNGNVGETAALPVKDPFHLPRAMMMLLDVFEELIEGESYDENKRV